jgi:excisionase family DNA binding protein
LEEENSLIKREIKTVGVKEAARRLNFTTKYVYDLVYGGKLRAKKVRRQWQIPLTAVEARLRQAGE